MVLATSKVLALERKFFRKEKLNGSEKRKKKNAKKTGGTEPEKARSKILR